MLGPDDLERLSRFRAGELPPAEAAELARALEERPELRQGLADLERLDRAAAELPETLDDATADRLVRGALGTPRPSRLAPWMGAAALAGALAAVLVMSLPGRAPAQVIAVSGAVAVNGRDLAPSAGAQALHPADRVETGPGGLAILALPAGRLGLPERTAVRLGPGAEVSVEAGTVLASGDGVNVAGLVVHGDAVLSVEPPGELDRVTDSIWASGGHMTKLDWTRWAAPAASAVAAGLTVFVLAGHAEGRASDGRAPVSISGGEQWSAGGQAPAPIALASRPPAGAGLAGGTDAARLEELARLRAERDSLLQQRDALLGDKRRPAPADAELAGVSKEAREAALQKDAQDREAAALEQANAYRPSAAAMKRRAEKNTFIFHGPIGSRDPGRSAVPASLQQELGLTPSEEQQVTEASQGSQRRTHDRLVDIYVAAGGERRLGEPLTSPDLIAALEKLPGAGSMQAALQQLSSELAGLSPPAAAGDGGPLLRALRAMAEEEAAYVDALDRILGPARAEALLNASAVGRSTSSWSSTQSP